MIESSESSSATAAGVREQLKTLMVETLMLQITPAEIKDEQPLFGPAGIGLDSVDALQLVVMLDKHFGLKISDADAARSVLGSVESMTAAVLRNQGR